VIEPWTVYATVPVWSPASPAYGTADVRTTGTGARLVDLVDERIGDIARAPTSFPRDRQEPMVRRARIHKFPCTRLFMVHDDAVVLLALAHGRRKPGYWRKRLRP
jgi:toxin ParE1/3/4